MPEPVDPWQQAPATPPAPVPLPPEHTAPPVPPAPVPSPEHTAPPVPPAPAAPYYPAAPQHYPAQHYPAQHYPAGVPHPSGAVPTGAVSHGYDPLTGQPLSDKSRVTAGLLQLIPGFLFGMGGIGRLYAGQTTLGVIQIVATVVGWMAFWCGFVLFAPFFVYVAVWVWFVVDGIVLLAGRPVDGQGRLLRA